MQVRAVHKCKHSIGTDSIRIRRKKCDETKPSCQRCKTTGRKCDGYENEPSSITTKARVSQFLQSSSSHTLVSPSRKWTISSRDSSYAEGYSIAHQHGRNPSLFECQLTSFVTSTHISLSIITALTISAIIPVLNLLRISTVVSGESSSCGLRLFIQLSARQLPPAEQSIDAST